MLRSKVDRADAALPANRPNHLAARWTRGPLEYEWIVRVRGVTVMQVRRLPRRLVEGARRRCEPIEWRWTAAGIPVQTSIQTEPTMYRAQAAAERAWYGLSCDRRSEIIQRCVDREDDVAMQANEEQQQQQQYQPPQERSA